MISRSQHSTGLPHVCHVVDQSCRKEQDRPRFSEAAKMHQDGMPRRKDASKVEEAGALARYAFVASLVRDVFICRESAEGVASFHVVTAGGHLG